MLKLLTFKIKRMQP